MTRFEKFLVDNGFIPINGYSNLSFSWQMENKYKHPESEKVYTIGLSTTDKSIKLLSKLNINIISKEFYYIRDFETWLLDNIEHSMLVKWLISGKQLFINLDKNVKRIIE
jgi:hypothetical protein